MITDPFFDAAADPAVLLLGLAKGGFSGLGPLSLPLMVLVVSTVRSAAVMPPILIVQDAVTVFAYRHTWDRKNLAIPLPRAISRWTGCGRFSVSSRNPVRDGKAAATGMLGRRPTYGNGLEV
jgi:hypothetical protein